MRVLGIVYMIMITYLISRRAGDKFITVLSLLTPVSYFVTYLASSEMDGS